MTLFKTHIKQKKKKINKILGIEDSIIRSESVQKNVYKNFNHHLTQSKTHIKLFIQIIFKTTQNPIYLIHMT